MQKYTELMLKELMPQIHKDRENQVSELAVSMNRRGLTYGSGHISSMLQIECDFIDKIIDDFFNTEKRVLSHSQETLSDDYFEVLKRELLEITVKEVDGIRSRVTKRLQLVGGNLENIYVSQLNQKNEEYETSINRRVDMLKEELRLGMLKPSQNTTIHIGGDVGALNTGVVYGSVQGEIKKIKESHDPKIAELFDRLLDIINISEISESNKKEQMQNVELLVQQYSKPQNERNYGLINASLTFLSAATNLSTLWAQYGQAIVDIFSR